MISKSLVIMVMLDKDQNMLYWLRLVSSVNSIDTHGYIKKISGQYLNFLYCCVVAECRVADKG